MENDSKVASPQDDGAGEKLVDEKNGHHSKVIEIKYPTPTSQNGDAKLDIENVKSAFAGMGKEELMKFANDPFWVRTRWFLFILFWLLWLAMLAGAIAIIVLAPKCAPPTPRQWWEQSPVYKADVASFSKEAEKLQGDIKGFTSQLKYIETLGVKSIVISNILKVGAKESDGVDEFKTIAPSFGTLEDFKNLISAAKKEDLKVILTLTPNHSSLKNSLFNQSAAKEPHYSSFYVWAPPKGNDLDGNPIPPNYWRSKTGGSAWEWNALRGEFYLCQFNKDEPEFNFHNPEVVKYFNDVMRFWLDLGVSGFYLERTPYLLEDKDFRNETFSRDKAGDHTQYEFYDHSRTKNLPELEPLLRGWKEIIANQSGVLLVDDVSLASNRSVAHLNILPQILEGFPTLSADDIQKLIKTTLAANPWPAWQVTVTGESEGSKLSQALLLTTLLLPGTPVTIAGQELGVPNLKQIPLDKFKFIANETKEGEEKQGLSIYSAYKKLVKERASSSILHGTIDMHVFNGTAVFAYTRIKSGSPGYLVVLNIGEEETAVDLRTLHSVPDDLTLLVSSSFTSDIGKKSGASVSLPDRTVNVYGFVPIAKE